MVVQTVCAARATLEMERTVLVCESACDRVLYRFDYNLVSFFVLLFIDINECIMDVCSVNAECANTEGSYECQCHAGFNTDGQICTGQCS